jgi:hypothetical protein
MSRSRRAALSALATAVVVAVAGCAGGTGGGGGNQPGDAQPINRLQVMAPADPETSTPSRSRPASCARWSCPAPSASPGSTRRR